jgi:ribose/xylose/arabinose/galactoside ABC-type transport system permease subunit
MTDGFFTLKNIAGIFKHVAIIAIAALGVTFVVVVGHTDISFYMIACFGAMLMSWTISLGLPGFPALLIGLLGGLVFGIASGAAVGIAKLPDIIITIAIGTIAFGCAYLFSDGSKIYQNFRQSGISFLNDGSIIGIPSPIFIMVVLYFIGFFVLELTTVGTFFYAMGSNKIAAYYSGINVPKFVMSAFIICVLLGTLAGEINTASVGNGEVKTALTFLLPCYTSVFIGNAIFRRPCVIGTFMGALLLQIVSNGFNHLNIKFYISDLSTAVLLVVALFISTLNNRNANEK